MSLKHGKPSESMECLASMDEITEENMNYCEYQTFPNMLWYPSLYSADIVEGLIATQFQRYIELVQKSDCKAELKRLLMKGPPIWLEDKHAMPLHEGETHICQVWYAKDNIERSSKLVGALEGEARLELWSELKQLLDESNDTKDI